LPISQLTAHTTADNSTSGIDGVLNSADQRRNLPLE
jgi:hypothetical protein